MLQDIPILRPRVAPAKARVSTDIETERLLLRRPTAADVPAIARLAHDRRIAEMTRLPFPYCEKDAATFVRALAPAYRGIEPVWLIEYLGEPVGIVGLALDVLPRLELGYWVGVAHWGRGFATEAARAAIGGMFDANADAEIAATARVANPASRSVLEKCGFVWAGCALHRSDLLGYSVPVDRFRLTREVWTVKL